MNGMTSLKTFESLEERYNRAFPHLIACRKGTIKPYILSLPGRFNTGFQHLILSRNVKAFQHFIPIWNVIIEY